MAGGTTTPELVAAVSNAGALGSLGGAYLGPDALRESIREIRRRTDRPFAVNLFAPHPKPEPAPETVEAVDAVLSPLRRELGLPAPEREPPLVPPDRLDDELAVVLEERVPVFSFTFGLPELDALREAGIVLMGTATTVEEATLLEKAGVHAVVAQGSEAGGHRGTFAAPFEQALVGTIALVPQVSDEVDVPVVAAGGIADGRGIAAALALGADGAQLGTAFIPCPESGAPEGHKRAVVEAEAHSTSVTRVYTGRAARALRTPLIELLESSGVEPAGFPAQALLLGDLRGAAAELDRADLLFLLAGQAAGLSRPLPAGELVQTLVAETEAALARGSPSRPPGPPDDR